MRKPKSTKPTEPEVGIFYLVKGKLLIDSTPLSKAGRHGEHLIHDRDHHQYWAQLVSTGAVPDNEYEEFPRGRVAYDTTSRRFSLLADKWILSNKSRVSMILSKMNLPVRETEMGLDSHYRCYRCLGKSR